MRLNLQKSLTEEELIDGCRKQNSKAQKALYEKYSGKMLGVVCRYINDRNEAEEIMLGGIMKVLDKIGQFKDEGSFEGWIRRIMVNEALGYLRKNKYMYAEVDIEKIDREPDYAQLDTQLEAEDLMNLINDMPVGYRTVFNLYAIEGYSHAEIGDQLGINVNTSKSQLSRARQMLQKKLAEIEDESNNKVLSHE